MLRSIATLDRILDEHSGTLGGDLALYRNHAYRVANLCAVQGAAGGTNLEKVAVAAAFHDLGIWTAGTFDYLPPSVELARAYLRREGHADWEPQVAEMIEQHHKLTPYPGDTTLVEPFRRADWADVSFGLSGLGTLRRARKELLGTWPDAGFHAKLVELGLKRLRSHPLSPLPMFRL